MTDTATLTDVDVTAQIAAWMRDLGAVRRLAAKTLEAYRRDLAQFVNFLALHTGGPVSVATLRDMRAADLRAFMATRRQDGVEARSLARALSAIKSFFRFSPIRRRIGEWTDDLQLLDDRARPTMCDDHRQSILVLGLHLDEMNVNPVNRRYKLWQTI